MTEPRAQLKSARLTLRAVLPDDQAAVMAAMNDLAVSGWLTRIPHPYSAADFAQFRGEYAVLGQTYAVADQGGCVGMLGIERRVLGYWLPPSAQGQGYATEAARVALSEHFRADQSPITSGYFEGNHASAHVLGKLGFVETGRSVRHCRALGIDRAHVDMALTYANFQAALPVQSSARLTFRDLMPHDAPALHAIVSEWDVVRQLGSWPWPADYDRTLARAAPFAGEGLVWGIFLHGALIGMSGITKGGLGYFIDPAQQRRGYGREAVRFIIEHAAQPYVEAEVWHDNLASLGLLYSLGFSILHPMQQMSKARGVMTDGFKLSWYARLP